MWYRAGSVTVANGSNVVTGAGTDFVSNAFVGDAFVGPDGRSYEIGQVVSATELRLATTYQAAGGGGQAYAIQPTQSFIRDLALQAGSLLNTFGAVRDGVGQGLFPDGSVAAPAVRFSADQDTGLRRYAANVLSIVCGGVDTVLFGLDGTSFIVGGARIAQVLTAGLGLDTGKGLFWAGNPNEALVPSDGVAGWLWKTDGRILIQTSTGGPKMVLDATGNLLVGVATGSSHRITKGGNGGDLIIGFDNGRYGGVAIFAGDDGPQGSSALSVMKLTRVATTQRSISAGGTINGSGADYAEYMIKAAGCGIIAKGDVCGVDRDGKLTKTWADAISFVVKSTDPSLVGGDTWAAHLPPRPVDPGEEPQPPTLPATPAEGADDAEVAAYQERLAAYPSQVAQHRVDHDAWAAATAAYARDLPAWEAELEAARVCVDRIAFCGQVPCNITGDFEVGDYIIPVQSGDGIKAVAVKDDDSLTDRQYRRRIGKVWAIREGRAWIDVQHG